MKLFEFFGRSINLDKPKQDDRRDKELDHDLFWFILDHDKLHKDYFFPLARKIKSTHKTESYNKEQVVAEFMPMVEKGCKEYYIKNKMQGKLGKAFPKELREELCEKLYNHYYEDIIKDCYNLGI